MRRCVILNIRSITSGTHGFSQQRRTMDATEFQPYNDTWPPAFQGLQRLCPQFCPLKFPWHHLCIKSIRRLQCPNWIATKVNNICISKLNLSNCPRLVEHTLEKSCRGTQSCVGEHFSDFMENCWCGINTYLDVMRCDVYLDVMSPQEMQAIACTNFFSILIATDPLNHWSNWLYYKCLLFTFIGLAWLFSTSHLWSL